MCLCRTRNYVFKMPRAKRKAPLSAHCSYAAGDCLQRTLLCGCGLAASLVRRYCCIPKDVYKRQGSYITFVEEETFLDDPEKYINNAYDKSENDASGYDLVKQR